MPQSITKSLLPEEPKLNPNQYSLRGFFIAIFSIFLIMYLRSAWIIDVNLYAVHHLSGTAAAYKIFMPTDLNLSQFAVFLAVLWIWRNQFWRHSVNLLRVAVAVFYVSYALFPPLLHQPLLAFAMLWLQSLLLLIVFWLALITISKWMPKNAMFIALPVFLFFIPSVQNFNAYLLKLLQQHPQHTVANMLIIGIVLIVLSLLLYSRVSPYAAREPKFALKPYAVLKERFFWLSALVLSLAAVAINLLGYTMLSPILLQQHSSAMQPALQAVSISIANYSATAVFVFSIIFAVIKNRTKLSMYILSAAAVLCLALLVYDFTAVSQHSFRSLAISCVAVSLLTYGYFYFYKYSSWSWSLAVLFVVISVVNTAIHMLAVPVVTLLPSDAALVIVLACCLAMALALRFGDFDSCAIMPVQLLPTMKRMLSGKESLARTFWGLGIYLLALAEIVSIFTHQLFAGTMQTASELHAYLPEAHKTQLSGPSYFIATVFAVFALLWAIAVWRCSRGKSHFVQYCSRVFAIFIALFYVGGFIAALHMLLRS